MRGIPLVLTEADSHLGLTNRLLAPRARRVCLAFPIEGRDGDRYLVTGRPVPPPFADRAAARAEFGIPPDATCVLVFGGSLGARSINLAAVEAFADAAFQVLHVARRARLRGAERAGRRTTTCASTSTRSARRSPPPTSPSRAPAARSSSSPSTGCRRSSIPYPHASADHQTANARWMAEAGAASILRDAELSPQRLRAEVDALLGDPERLGGMAAASAAWRARTPPRWSRARCWRPPPRAARSAPAGDAGPEI